MTKQDSGAKITSVVDKMVVRCDEIAVCAQDRGKQVCNLLRRGDSTVLALTKIAHRVTLPLKQVLLICFQKLQDQLTVGC